MKKLYLTTVSSQIRDEYRREVVRINGTVLSIFAVLAVFAELFNIVRVLFYSKSGLGTQNNRIYFTFYLTLLAAAVLFLGIRRCIRKRLFGSYVIKED